jgi:hypothetical protein
MPPVRSESSDGRSPSEAELAGHVCLPFLKAAQDRDGGWGFRPGAQSRVEATAWAVLALAAEDGEQADALRRKGLQFLRVAQLEDGSWPASPAQSAGCWVTSLATWALADDTESRTPVSRGLRWICDDLPRSGSIVRRLIRKLHGSEQLIEQSEALRGWGWTPRTASWIEPTAFALIALEQAPRELLPNDANERIESAKLLIYDRMCPGGGWNCGNPMVYGVAGEPLIEPTVWALLALRSEPERREKVQSLDWLEKNAADSAGPGSAALAKICLESFQRRLPAGTPSITQLYGNNEFLLSVPVAAWTLLSVGNRRGFLRTRRRNAHG